VDNYFTFTGRTVGNYVENHPEYFSEYERVLDTTGVMGLLKAYGLYTCFIPTNDAMQLYYESRGREKLSDFSMDEIKTFCYNHIIKGDTIASIDFSEGALSSMNMNGRYVSVSFSDTSSTIYMNGSAPIIEKDVFCTMAWYMCWDVLWYFPKTVSPPS
jgi:Fasciclin domain.